MREPATRSRSLAAIAMLASALIACAANGGSFQINPIRVELDARSTSQSLIVRNDATEPLVVQLSLQSWQQADGNDLYHATSDALVTPPIVRIPPGGEQVVRVGLRRAPDASRQLAYRLFVQEVPQAAATGFSGLQVALRIGIPVFVAPTTPTKRDLAWSAARLADGSVRIAVENRGNAHLQLVDLVLLLPGIDEPIARHQQLAYVLAGQTRNWVLPARWPGNVSASTVKLRAFGDGREIDVELRWRPSRCAPILLAVIAAAAMAQPTSPTPTLAQAISDTELLLEVDVNGVRVADAALMLRSADGQLHAAPESLRAWRACACRPCRLASSARRAGCRSTPSPA